MTEEFMPEVSFFDYLAEINPEALSMKGYDDCIVGICHFYSGDVVAYDRKKVIEKLMKRDGMTIEEAEEFFEYNTLGAYVGEYTPRFVRVFNRL